MITNPDETGGFSGMLIDLDLAKVLGSGRSGARHQTGTMEFMAIEVLLGIDHTYRHDLESFFYVLIWLCARRGWGFCGNPRGRPKESVLMKWYTGSFKDIARSKLGDMHVDGFDDILEEFPPSFDCVKPLCRKIRGILFPLLGGGALFKGTRPGPPEKLYDAVIEAFDSAIAGIPPRQELELAMLIHGKKEGYNGLLAEEGSIVTWIVEAGCIETRTHLFVTSHVSLPHPSVPCSLFSVISIISSIVILPVTGHFGEKTLKFPKTWIIAHFMLSFVELSPLLIFSVSHHHLPSELMLSPTVGSTYARMIWLATASPLVYIRILCGDFTNTLSLRCQARCKRRGLNFMFRKCTIEVVKETALRRLITNIFLLPPVSFLLAK